MERCPTHDLALSPSGECILCRRASAPAAAPPGAPAAPGSIAPLAVLVCVLVAAAGTAGALFALREPRRIASQEIVPFAPGAETAPLEQAPPPIVTAPEITEREARAERARARRTERARAETRARQPAAEMDTTEMDTAELNAAEMPAAAMPARPERLGDARSEAAPTATPDRHALAAARRRVSITMYGAPWCGYCRRAEQWLRANSIAFVLRDVDADPSAAQQMRRINPRGGIPAFEIDGEVMLGYSQGALERAIDRAAARHM